VDVFGLRALREAFHIQLLDDDGVIVADQPRADSMQEVQARP
jgi:hypothetical protein